MSTFVFNLIISLVFYILGYVIIILWIVKNKNVLQKNKILWSLLFIVFNILGLSIYVVYSKLTQKGTRDKIEKSFILGFILFTVSLFFLYATLFNVNLLDQRVRIGCFSSNIGNVWKYKAIYSSGNIHASFSLTGKKHQIIYNTDINKGTLIFSVLDDNSKIITEIIPINVSDTITLNTQSRNLTIEASMDSFKGNFLIKVE